MTNPEPGLVASVKQRLLNRARERGEEFQSVLVRFGVERFLYRLSQSPFADRHVVKGATLFTIWLDEPHRPTRDLDLAALETETLQSLEAQLREIFDQPCREDAVLFDPSTLSTSQIRGGTLGGIRAKFLARLGSSRIPLQIDFGFGDATHPPPEIREYPSLLDLPRPRLKVYAKEQLIAEKFEAMVRRGRLNSRIKDFADVAFLASNSEFEGRDLYESVIKTFESQATAISDADQPPALRPDFYRDAQKNKLWEGIAQESPPIERLGSFSQAGNLLSKFLGPLWAAMTRSKSWNASWTPPGPWKRKKGSENGL